MENGCVLFAGNELEDYYYSIGGGVHHGETAEDAVKREVLEETGVPYEIDRLAVIHENFFTQSSGTLKGLNCHEISFPDETARNSRAPQQQHNTRRKRKNALASHQRP